MLLVVLLVHDACNMCHELYIIKSRCLDVLSKLTFVNVIEQIGPGVSISANARIGAGARLINCIVLDDVEIKASLHINWFLNA